MICFFCFSKGINITHKEGAATYTHSFQAVDNFDNIPIDKIYFSTPSDFSNQLTNIQNQLGDAGKNIAFAIDPQMVVAMNNFPKDIGFSHFEQKLEQFKGKEEVKIAILNAMSNATGDHLMGMRAFDYWYKKVCELLPNTKIVISFFQLDPNGLADITKQYTDKINHLYMIPNDLTMLVQQDAYIDLGTLLLRDGFNTQHMIDFFFRSLSIDPETVPAENKRMVYDIDKDVLKQTDEVMNIIKSKKRPILLFHHTSSDPIRQLDAAKARSVVAEIINKSDYFVVSAVPLEFSNNRFLDMSTYSESLDHFASIIAHVDAIITVDTCTYHIADAFGTPTVALFTSIDPDLRCRYYPNVKPIMYETKDGILYGKHKKSTDDKESKKELDHLATLWEKINVDEILNQLNDLRKSQTLR